MSGTVTRLHTYIVAHYSLEELRTLCFALDVPYDDLPGDGLSGQARELILYLERQERLPALLDRLERDQPTLYAQAKLDNDLSPPEAALSDARSAVETGREQSQPAAGQTQAGGIRAGRIEADNVIVGVQQLGGSPADAAGAVALAEALRQGSITADSIQAQNVVAGFQYIADPAQATAGELRQEVARLRRQVTAAVADGEMEQSADVDDVLEALEKAETELAKDEPQGGRIIRKLKEASDIFTEGARTAEAARKAGQAVVKLAPAVAALYQIATQLFGG